MSYDKKVDVFTRYREFNDNNSVNHLKSLASLIKRIIPKTKRSGTLQEYINAMEKPL